MARTMGRGSDQAGGRGSEQVVSRGVRQGISQHGGRGVGQGSSQGSVQTSGRGVGQGRGQGSFQAGGRGVGLGASRGSGQVGDRGFGQDGGQVGDRGVRRNSGIGSSDTIGLNSHEHQDADVPFPYEGSDDDESTLHAALARRGRASHVQVPELMNREWIWIEEGEFSNQQTSTRIIGVILKALWNGPWDSWRDVPNEEKTRLFERFHCYFQWEEKWSTQIYKCWEKCIASKFPDLLRRVRDDAKARAREKDLEVGDDMSVLIDFKPPWIRSETWKQMIDIWNTPEWKAKSQKNSDIRSKSIGGKHTLGSQTYVTAKRKAAKMLGRELTPREMWKQSHCRKGSRPLDKYLSRSHSLDSNFDLEGNVEEENLDWVDERAKETWVKYEGYLVEKYGKEGSENVEFDDDLWSRAAGGKNRGKVYGLNNVSDPHVHGRQDPEIKKCYLVIKELVKEKEEEKEEKERLKEIIAELVTDNEKHKVEKEDMLNKMTNIEDILKNLVRR